MAHNKTDIICKATVEDHAEDMLRFFYPEAEGMFDFSKGFEFLDTTLSDIIPDNENIKDSKIADKVLKVYTISGDAAYIIINIEFQTYYDPQFNKRMFTYFYRLFDKYDKPVTLLVIYTDKPANNNLSSFNSSLINTDLHFSFMPYRVWEQDEDKLFQSSNPYAFVILTIQIGRKHDENIRLAKGIILAKRIFNKPFSDRDKLKLLGFMKLYFHFENPDLRIRFEHEIDVLKNKIKNMGIIEYSIREKVAKNLLKLGIVLSVIQEATELPLDLIKELQLEVQR